MAASWIDGSTVLGRKDAPQVVLITVQPFFFASSSDV
jgi:hypothetical protein